MYKDLMLNRTNIMQAIKFYCLCNYNTSDVSEEKNDHFTRYKITFDDKQMFLDVFYNKKGGTTIQINNGKFIDQKEKLAAYIVESDLCKMSSETKKNRSMVYKHISLEDFEEIMKMIPEEEYYSALISRNDLDNSIVIKLEGKWSDKISITYYKTTKTVMLQGRPLALFSAVSSLFSELINVDDIVECLDKSYQMDISKESVEEQFVALLPKAHPFLTDKLKKSLLKSVYNLNLPPQDYTCTELVFEVLRALEGHIKLTLLKDYEISSTNKYGTLSIFHYSEETNTISIDSTVESQISDSKKVDYYKEAYKFLKEYRHKIFHWDYPDEVSLDETEQIEDINDAKTIIRDTLKLIDKYY